VPFVESSPIDVFDHHRDGRKRLAREQRRPHQLERIIAANRCNTDPGRKSDATSSATSKVIQ
jgi:hypothetical protein